MRRAEVDALQSSVQRTLDRIGIAGAATRAAAIESWAKSFYGGTNALPAAEAAFDALCALIPVSTAEAAMEEMIGVRQTYSGKVLHGGVKGNANVHSWVAIHPAPTGEDHLQARNLSQWTVVEMALGTTKLRWADLQAPIVNLITDLDAAANRAQVETCLAVFHGSIAS